MKIGSARIDENGNATGGSAGDQKQTTTPDYSGEVSMQDFYVHSKGWYVLRPISAAHAAAIAERMQTACNNAHLGYDQDNRNGVIRYGIETEIDTECDCSSLVRACVLEATGTDPGNFTTSTEVYMLEATGLFEDAFAFVSLTETPLYNGDILVTKTKGHTVIVVSGSERPDKSGWVEEDGGWRYYLDGGNYVVNSWLESGGFWYWFDGAGLMVTDVWYMYNGGWYYLGPDGAMLTGLQDIDGKWYALDADGRMITDPVILTPDDDGALVYTGLAEG